ncbi:MAG: helix-turn-helix domain-containing protein [Lachnospiraceae bacterium]
MNIREMRYMTGQTQKEFANRFGIPIGTLRRWEYGESKPAPYVLKMIADQLPLNQDSLSKLNSAYGTFYYDKSTNIIMDCLGTKISVTEDLEGVKEQNLAIYAKDLFEAYYEAVERFNNDCKLDKQEDILWG